MADPSLYSYPDPLHGWEGLEPLSNERNVDGKSLKNPTPIKLSSAYTQFPAPIPTGSQRAAFDVHIYYLQTSPSESKFAQHLHERIRREFPELRVYTLWDKPIGPHPVAMFEINLFTPAQFGAFIPWLVINRGPLSALVHPNTGDDERDHTQRATWMGQPYPLQTGMLRKAKESQVVSSGRASGPCPNGLGVNLV
ncbi:Putative Dopa 4,5-dioxygenase, DOPA-like superfamily [Septoria linicola]|uniref:Dopa 4,5-dioxygenase, DOPA-like superfamily n=1 Tax=Septoria linicola TaxID=215465 RepID=A0A9Q9AZG9_9PEZI|nr:Putative Dopa 4,5-dioxygenase, DOPA-like superfamily [Septoria linicola]